MQHRKSGTGPPQTRPTIIYLGTGASDRSELSFSQLAYRGMVRVLPWLPRLDNLDTETIEVPSNAAIVPELLKQPEAYAVLPVSTLSGGHIDESLFPLAMLQPGTPITALLGYKMRLSFSMFGNPGTELNKAAGVLGHPRALQACKSTIVSLGLSMVPVDNNATGLRMVRTEPAYKRHVALGPHIPVPHLEVKQESCEDAPAYTTFVLLHHGADNRSSELRSKTCRTIVAFEIDDILGQLATAMMSLQNWNVTYLTSMYNSNLLGYRFVAELECGRDSKARLQRDLMSLTHGSTLAKLVSFGPFPVIHSDRAHQ